MCQWDRRLQNKDKNKHGPRYSHWMKKVRQRRNTEWHPLCVEVTKQKEIHRLGEHDYGWQGKEWGEGTVGEFRVHTYTGCI